ncbi:hypothetical protein [Acrocarpospora sp. B8E8]|uniref:hypothetical protein n=1 Tax=Acrocarpospora sp. B8E8 TaxID=3153572 RepID=UPI00325DD735
MNWFTCKRSLSIGHEFDIYYNIDGFSIDAAEIPLNGIPDVDTSPANGVPDAIDKIEASLRVAWSQYQSMGYGLTGDRVEIYVGFDVNDNPGLTFPFGDFVDGGPVIFLPTDPAEMVDANGNPFRNEEWYTYLIRHELFHAVQYHYLPSLHFFGHIPSINWWMEATAEWATDVVYRQANPAEAGWQHYARALKSVLAEAGGPESALNASDGLGGSRQYGAFIFAEYLAERTGTVDFVRKTWEEMDDKLPLEAIEQVLAGYGLNLITEVQGFAVANYRLTGKTTDLSAFIGAADGYSHAHATTTWRGLLGADARPRRAAQSAMTWGGSASGSTRIWHGGASYLEFTPPATGNGRLSVRVDAPDQAGVDSEVEFNYFLVAWNNLSSRTPLRWARALSRGDEETHELTIKINAGEAATLIAVRSDLWQESQNIPNSLAMGQVVNWTATMAVQAGTQMNGALNAMWENQAANAGCADWSGGDAVQSLKLPSGKRAWFFSDTFLGDPSKRPTGTDTSFMRNSVVVQNGSSLRTITGGSTCQETDPNTDFWSRYAKTPVGEGGQYWTGDSKVAGNDVVKFYYEGVGDENTRGSYARLPIAGLETSNTINVTPTRLQDCSARNSLPIIWGASLLDHDGYTYIYGWEGDGANAEKSLFLARTPGNVNLTDQSQWRYFAGPGSNGAAQWETTCATAKPLAPKVEIDFSVVRVNGSFWLVHHTPASQAPGNIVAVPSRSAWGFGTTKVDLYTPPETTTNPAYSSVYGARVQPGILPDSSRVLISYTVSKSAANLSCWTRGYYFPDHQYPRFVEVPVSEFFTAAQIP